MIDGRQDTSEPVAAADLQALLQRFADTLAEVIGGLSELANAVPASEGAPDPASGAVPRAAELADLLARNDTRAEQVVAEILAGWQGAAPAWLASVARDIERLDYPSALDKLRAAGAI